jgi:hypothetical protein
MASKADVGRMLIAKVRQLWRETPKRCQGIEKHYRCLHLRSGFVLGCPLFSE